MILVAAATIVRAQPYLARAITLLVPFPPGGSSDIVMRRLPQKVAESLRQTIVRLGKVVEVLRRARATVGSSG